MAASDSGKDALQRVLACDGVTGAGIILRDGRPAACQFAGGVDDWSVAAMGAASLAAMETAASELRRPTVDHMTINTPEGRLVVAGVDDDSLVIVTGDADASAEALVAAAKQARSMVENPSR